ncbi:glycosyltransferase [Candidatus Magnetoovum chiemensis]|nr:glycosyltransferase [Candidatus Magnetoovum chiemensis]
MTPKFKDKKPLTAIIICNWNKKDYVLNTIESALKLNYNNRDIYVLDNASTDGSQEAIKQAYPQLTLIENTENTGGSGGFNKAAAYALQTKPYDYLYLLDNDVSLDKDALITLITTMEKDKNIAVCGSKIYSMDDAKRVQEIGANIDWHNFYVQPVMNWESDSDALNGTIEVDYVPACSMAVRAEAVKIVGLMDSEFFLYWDDIEWCHRFKRQGFKVCALSTSKVWHKMGVLFKKTTAPSYYFWRNRIDFFLTYLNRDRIEKFAAKITQELYEALFTCFYFQKYTTIESILHALNDALTEIRGKAKATKVFTINQTEDLLKNLIESNKRLVIIAHPDKALNRVMSLLSKSVNVQILTRKEDKIADDSIIIAPVAHLFASPNNALFDQIKQRLNNEIYLIDRFINITKYDTTYTFWLERFNNLYDHYKNIFLPILTQKMINSANSNVYRESSL